MGLDRLWAGWRSDYVSDIERLTATTGVGTLFEAILASGRPDRDTGIVGRGPTCFVILNRYPYTSGHLLVMPNRGVPDLDDLTSEEFTELWATVHTAVTVLRRVYEPHGLNVGANLGEGSGAGVPDHLHVHVVPRWEGDTNFTVAVAETRVLPESLDVTWERLSAAWPA